MFAVRLGLTLSMLPLLAGCGAGALIHCADSVIPRGTEQKAFQIETFDLSGQPLATTKIACHKHYDAQCSVRGNQYRYQQKVEGDTAFQVVAETGHRIEVTFPRCQNLLDATVNASHFGRFMIDPVTGKRKNNLIYVYEKGKIGNLSDLAEGYVYYDQQRQLRPIPLPFRFTLRVVEGK